MPKGSHCLAAPQGQPDQRQTARQQHPVIRGVRTALRGVTLSAAIPALLASCHDLPAPCLPARHGQAAPAARAPGLPDQQILASLQIDSRQSRHGPVRSAGRRGLHAPPSQARGTGSAVDQSDEIVAPDGPALPPPCTWLMTASDLATPGRDRLARAAAMTVRGKGFPANQGETDQAARRACMVFPVNTATPAAAAAGSILSATPCFTKQA